MSAARRRAMLLWVAMPLLLGACGFGLSRGARALAWFPDASKGVSDPGESALAAALEDVVWRHGSAQDIRAVLGANLRLQRRAPGAETRTLIRLAAVADTPDARAALLSRACASDPKVCAALPRELEQVARTLPGTREAHLLAPPEATAPRASD
jgi:hypothetical protein